MSERCHYCKLERGEKTWCLMFEPVEASLAIFKKYHVCLICFENKVLPVQPTQILSAEERVINITKNKMFLEGLPLSQTEYISMLLEQQQQDALTAYRLGKEKR